MGHNDAVALFSKSLVKRFHQPLSSSEMYTRRPSGVHWGCWGAWSIPGPPATKVGWEVGRPFFASRSTIMMQVLSQGIEGWFQHTKASLSQDALSAGPA